MNLLTKMKLLLSRPWMAFKRYSQFRAAGHDKQTDRCGRYMALITARLYFSNNGFICVEARMLDYTISATQDSAYNITQIII